MIQKLERLNNTSLPPEDATNSDASTKYLFPTSVISPHAYHPEDKSIFGTLGDAILRGISASATASN